MVWHVSLKRQLARGGPRQSERPTKPRFIVLASTDLALDGRKLVELYVARFQIEFLFRDSKQFTGLLDCQARAEAASIFISMPRWRHSIWRAPRNCVPSRAKAPRLLDGKLETTAFQ